MAANRSVRSELSKFEQVSFAYEEGVPVLRDLNFRVAPGEIVGIVGPSGSGKSTLIQLLLRLRSPTSGTVLVDGRAAERIDLDEWYRHVSLVPQDAHLFAASIANNIRFFRDLDDSSVQHAAKLAHLHDDIAGWPLGYATPVGEHGGQVGRSAPTPVYCTSALAEEPNLIVFDEPTSSLDVRSESLVRETIGDLGGRTTVFIIAHRMSTLAICDRIMVLLDGVLEGFDRPEALESTNPFYREALRLSGMR